MLVLAQPIWAHSGERGVPASQGIINFGKVNDGLYRGAQPDAAGIRNLKKLGIRSIINLRMADDVWKAEASEAGANGILYTNLPMKGYGRPKPEQVAQALALIEGLPSPVFIHCAHGCERTGTIIACYRVKHDHWSADLALEEARRYGISKWAWGMRKYIAEFGRAATSVAHASANPT